MQNIILIILTILCFQCNRNSANKQVITDEKDKFFVIDYEKALQNKKTIHLSDVAEDVKYIPLQTDSNCLLARKPEYHFTEQYIFIENRDHVLVYDYSGKFIRKIGTPGKGPNEVDLIRMLVVNDKDKTIALQTNWNRKLLYFTYEGTFIESVAVPDIMYLYTLGKDRFIAYSFGAFGNEDYLLRLTNRNNDTISSVKNYFKWENNTGSSYLIGYWGYYPHYTYKDKHFFKTMYNDSVYTVIGDELVPAYFVDLGKYRLPDNARFENPVSMEKFRKVSDSYFFASTAEAAGHIFVSTIDYADNIHRNILHQQKLSESSYLVKEYGEPSGFVNDWDGGPEFWPEGKVNDQSVFMPVPPIKLLDMIDDENFAEKDVVYTDKKKELLEMIKGLKEEDNAVLMVVELKN